MRPCSTWSVLIPSRSGRGLECRIFSGRLIAHGLNPFSIRAWARIAGGVAHYRLDRLNPFSIRAWARIARVVWPRAPGCLNPFSIRAWARIFSVRHSGEPDEVLIPSRSGRGLEFKGIKMPDGRVLS